MSEQVYAVVVTFNRKELLCECIEALRRQSRRVDRILVIDNASTDGTAALFADDGYYGSEPQISYICLAKNVGGAGGYHEGFKRALEHQPDWIWAMDDDGLPDVTCLERLVAAPPTAGQFRGPVVLSRERIADPNNDQLAFPNTVETAEGDAPLRTVADLETFAHNGVLTGFASAFNGVLIRRELVERVGLPNENFFFWGDELDYIYRTKRAGFAITTVLAARYWHPRDRAVRANIRVGLLQYDVPYADEPFRNYLLIRNYAYLAVRHRGVIPWVRHTIKYLLYHRTPAGCFTSRQVLRFSIEGLIGRFNGKGEFA